MIAYRLQAERLGDLDRDTQRFLDQVATGTRDGDKLRQSAITFMASSPEPSWYGSGTASPSASWPWTRALPGTAPPIAA
jgi:hypothetical protein